MADLYVPLDVNGTPRRCRVCDRMAWPDWPLGVEGVISPTGREHVGKDGGTTLCGKDATGDTWWWPA